MTRLLDLIRGLFGLTFILLLLAGIPALLVVIVGYPLPTELPPMEVVQAHIEDGDIPDVFLIKTLALVVWLVWAQLAVATLVEIVAVLRGRLSARAPVLPGVQLFAGKLVASTMLLISAFSPSRTLAAAPITAPTLAAASMEVSVAEGSPAFGGERLDGTIGSNVADLGQRPIDGDDVGPRTEIGAGVYTTKSGDSWWEVAERLMGDGLRWSELRSLNAGRTMLTGEVVDERTEAVRAGWQLVVPADADPTQLDAEEPGPGQAAASDPARSDDDWSLVQALRPDRLIYEGPTGAQRDGIGPAYQVVEGDNLWDIAERHLGDPFRWPEIYEASTDLTQTFGRRITDPNLIWPDSILVLPDDAVDVPTADPGLVADVLGIDPVDIDADQGPTPDHGAPGSDDPRADDLHDMAAEAAEAAAGGRGPDAVEDGAAADPPVDTEPVRAADPAPTDPDGPGGPDGGQPAPDPVPAGALALAGGGVLLATGLLGLLSRARRLRLAETGEASVPAPPPMELVDVETVLRNRADPVATSALLAAVGTLTDPTGNRSAVVPEIIRVGHERIEAIVAESSAPLPSPWQQVDVVGASLPAGRRAVAAGADALAAAEPPNGEVTVTGHDRHPTLVTVGDGLLVNLEAVGVVRIDGVHDTVMGLARAMLHELAAVSAVGPAGAPVDVIVSDRLAGVGVAAGTRTLAASQLATDLDPWLEEVELRLAATGADGLGGLRPPGATTPTTGSVVVMVDGAELADGLPAADVARRAADRRLPLAVVAIGPTPPGSMAPSLRIDAGTDLVRLEPLGLRAVALDLDLDLILGVEALIDHARRAPIVPRPEITWSGHEADLDTPLPIGGRSLAAPGSGDVGRSGAERGQSGPSALATGDPAQIPTEETPEREIVTERPSEDEGDDVTDRSDDEEAGLLVRVLGPVEVEGGPGDLSDTQTAIVAFLALAGPSTADQIAAAVAPERPDERAAIDADLVVLADRLGPLFPQAGDGRHRVRSTITDLGSARRWIAQAAALSEERARNLLQLALSEVRGRPFTGVDQRYWQWIEDHRLAIATQATSLLMDACFDLCDSAYGADDFHLANWACEVGSMVDPLHETAVTRQVQLLGLLGRGREAADIVDRWERAFARSAGRPAPHGPRLALDTGEPSPGGVAPTAPPTNQEVATHVG